jgi:hypothetical protein
MHHDLDIVGVESNGVGSVFANMLTSKVKSNNQIMFINQSTNKHTRIVTHAPGVRMKVVLRSDAPPGGMYDKAMRQMFRYNKDKTLNDWDDAPDSVTGAKMLNDDLLGY